MNFAETAALSTPARRSGRGFVDLNAVLPQHRQSDGRLANWGRWCHGPIRREVSPMFRGMPREPQLRIAGASAPEMIDGLDASKLAKAVGSLPEKHRAALNWCYISPGAPKRICQKLGTSFQGLADLLNDARQMLINRGA